MLLKCSKPADLRASKIALCSKRLSMATNSKPFLSQNVFPYWNDLENICCHITMLSVLNFECHTSSVLTVYFSLLKVSSVLRAENMADY